MAKPSTEVLDKYPLPTLTYNVISSLCRPQQSYSLQKLLKNPARHKKQVFVERKAALSQWFRRHDAREFDPCDQVIIDIRLTQPNYNKTNILMVKLLFITF